MNLNMNDVVVNGSRGLQIEASFNMGSGFCSVSFTAMYEVKDLPIASITEQEENDFYLIHLMENKPQPNKFGFTTSPLVPSQICKVKSKLIDQYQSHYLHELFSRIEVAIGCRIERIHISGKSKGDEALPGSFLTIRDCLPIAYSFKRKLGSFNILFDQEGIIIAAESGQSFARNGAPADGVTLDVLKQLGYTEDQIAKPFTLLTGKYSPHLPTLVYRHIYLNAYPTRYVWVLFSLKDVYVDWRWAAPTMFDEIYKYTEPHQEQFPVDLGIFGTAEVITTHVALSESQIVHPRN